MIPRHQHQRLQELDFDAAQIRPCREAVPRGLHRVDPNGALGPVVFGTAAGVHRCPISPTHRHQRAVAVHHRVERLLSESSQSLGFSGRGVLPQRRRLGGLGGQFHVVKVLGVGTLALHRDLGV